MSYKSDIKLNERIAAIRAKNVHLENKHIEAELDKQWAAESGSLILPSQIKVTISRPDIHLNHNCLRTNGNNFKKISSQQNVSRYIRGGNYISNPAHHTIQNSLPQAGSQSRSFVDTEYIRSIEISRPVEYGKTPKFATSNNRKYYGDDQTPSRTQQDCQTAHSSQRNLQQPINLQRNRNSRHSQREQWNLSSAKSLPSLDPSAINQNTARSNRFYKAPLLTSPTARAESERERGSGSPQTDKRVLRPTCPTLLQEKRPPGKWPPPPVSKNRVGNWVRGNVIRSEDSKTGASDKLAVVGTQSKHQPRHIPLFNGLGESEFDEDGYIDDNPLEDLDQFTLKIDMDGGFIVHDATICDPILSKPISSWMEDMEVFPSPETPSRPVEVAEEEEDVKVTNYLRRLSTSSLTASGQSTLSSSDLCQSVIASLSSSFHRSHSLNHLDRVAPSTKL